jgi:hypothetical protein
MSYILETLKDQTAFGFTGKINFLLKESGQFLGVIYQKDGFIVGAQYGELGGMKAILKMTLEDFHNDQKYKFIVEPEVIGAELQSIKLTHEEVKFEAEKCLQQHFLAKKLRPADHLKLVIDPEVIVSKEELSPIEFDVLSTMTEWCLVSDIYKNNSLMDYDITNALVSLRKKRAIKVFQN